MCRPKDKKQTYASGILNIYFEGRKSKCLAVQLKTGHLTTLTITYSVLLYTSNISSPVQSFRYEALF